MKQEFAPQQACPCQECPWRPESSEPIVAWMELKQVRLGLPHKDFVRLVGMSTSLWLCYRRDEKKPSVRMVRHLIDLWPKDERAILAAVRQSPTQPAGRLDE